MLGVDIYLPQTADEIFRAVAIKKFCVINFV